MSSDMSAQEAAVPDERDRERAEAWLDKRTGIWQPERQAVSVLRLVGPDDLAALLAEVRAEGFAAGIEEGRARCGWLREIRDPREVREVQIAVGLMRDVLADPRCKIAGEGRVDVTELCAAAIRALKPGGGA